MIWPSFKTTQPYTSWTHRLARSIVRPLVHTAVTPNHLTTVRFLSGLLAILAFAYGTREGEIWGGVSWIICCFLDRADGELARLSGKCSPVGHTYDYVTDVILNAALFVGIGVGQRYSHLGMWAVLLGLIAGASIIGSSVWGEWLEKIYGSGKKAYSGVAGFDLDDALYLLGPFAWLSWLEPVLIGAAICAPVFALVAWRRLSRALRVNAASAKV
ncbi:MAG TPA: CDP-alcohol phosphatidyltransferase family protein [Burkholderiales bacterium]|nr:CDP-alcohol phosphatidyltransferase family protein [Burkholderiales bacterium]